MSILGYCKEALVRFGHMASKKRDQPNLHIAPKYGQTIQYEKEQDETQKVDRDRKTLTQQVLGAFLYYAKSS